MGGPDGWNETQIAIIYFRSPVITGPKIETQFLHMPECIKYEYSARIERNARGTCGCVYLIGDLCKSFTDSRLAGLTIRYRMCKVKTPASVECWFILNLCNVLHAPNCK